MPLHEKESHFILIIPLLWASDKEYVLLDVLTKNSFVHGLSYKICPLESKKCIKNIYKVLEAICTFAQAKQIRHLHDAIKLLSHVLLIWSVLALYHDITTALYKHNALQVEDMRGKTRTMRKCIQ